MSRAAAWTQQLLDSPHGLAWLGVLSALETIILPIPIELIMVPYMLARPQRLWLIAGVTLLGVQRTETVAASANTLPATTRDESRDMMGGSSSGQDHGCGQRAGRGV